MPPPMPRPDPVPAAATRSARQRRNLLDQITSAAVVSDYADVPDAADRGSGSRREQVLVAAVALALAGFVLALGVSARLLSEPAVNTLRAELVERVDAADARNRALSEELVGLRAAARTAQEEGLALTATGRQVAEDVGALEVATGYAAVTGPGAVVTMSDAVTDESTEDPELARVLDTDLQLAANGLWAAGAEAMAINGQRLTAQSAIRSAAGAILVNYRPLKPPYRLEAIGPPDLALLFDRTAEVAQLRDVSAQFGIGLASSSADVLRLRPATTPLPEQAQVVDPDEGNAP